MRIRAIFKKYQQYYREDGFISSVIMGVLFLALSLLINYASGQYATNRASNAVTDIIFSNIPVFNVSIIFVQGSIAFWIATCVLIISEPRWIPFSLKSISLFVLIRSFFVILTHIGPFPSQIELQSNFFIDKIAFGGDLFFSGHTGLPFLLALIFWDNLRLRFAFIALSIMFGTSVILGHIHYSIDVFSAFFITYSIYHICRVAFPKDLKLFEHGMVESGKTIII